MVYLWGMRVGFWRYLDFSKSDRFKILTYFVKNFYKFKQTLSFV